jgi:hypothetical protein
METESPFLTLSERNLNTCSHPFLHTSLVYPHNTATSV